MNTCLECIHYPVCEDSNKKDRCAEFKPICKACAEWRKGVCWEHSDPDALKYVYTTEDDYCSNGRETVRG